MTRGKQKIEAQRRNAWRNQKPKGSQLEARAVALKAGCPHLQGATSKRETTGRSLLHPKEKIPTDTS